MEKVARALPPQALSSTMIGRVEVVVMPESSICRTDRSVRDVKPNGKPKY